MNENENIQMKMARLSAYINSDNFQGSDKDRFINNSAINHLTDNGLEYLDGMSSDEIINEVSRFAVQLGDKESRPKHHSLGGLFGMAVGLPSAVVETGGRMLKEGVGQGFKHGVEVAKGSRPSKLGAEASMMLDLAAPWAVPKMIKGVGRTAKTIADMPRKARVDHIGRTKRAWRFEKAYAADHARGAATEPFRQESLAAAYNRMVNAPKQWGTVKKTARTVMDKVEPSGANNIRRMIDKIVERGGSSQIQATRIDKMLFEQYNKGAINTYEARAFNVYAADAMGKKINLPLTSDISELKSAGIKVGKGVSAKTATSIKTRQTRQFRNQRPIIPNFKRKVKVKAAKPAKPTKSSANSTTPANPTANPTPEQQIINDTKGIVDKVLERNKEIAEFNANINKNTQQPIKPIPVLGDINKKVVTKKVVDKSPAAPTSKEAVGRARKVKDEMKKMTKKQNADYVINEADHAQYPVF